jgi:hypothetical protein
VLPATRPLRDPDIWWHVRLGELILHDGIPHHEIWSYTILGRDWHPTAWLSDVALASLHDAGGWRAIVLFKVLASAAVLVLLYRQVMPQARAEISSVVYVAALASVGTFFTERPQVLSFILVLVIGPWARRLATTGNWQPWHWVAITYAWCNLHGMWVLAPALLATAAVAWTIQTGPSRLTLRTLGTALAAAALAIGSTTLTPVGPGLTLQPLAVRAVGQEITEWQPTSLLGNAPLAFGILLLLLVLSWAIRPPESRGLLILSLAIVVFSFVAVRNIAPATLLLAPVVADASGRAFSHWLPRAPSTVPRPIAMTLVTVITLVVAFLAFLRPATDPTLPWHIADRLEALPQPKHVVADYLVSGFLTGEAHSVSLAMDTRTDNFPKRFARDYLAMFKLGPHWRQTLREVDPDYAVLLSDSGFRQYLQKDRGWVLMEEEHGFVLLHPPTSRTSS